jgi:hypothetical protein
MKDLHYRASALIISLQILYSKNWGSDFILKFIINGN